MSSDQLLHRSEFLQMAPGIRSQLFQAVMAAHDSNITDEAFSELVLECMYTYSLVARAEMMESISQSFATKKLSERLIHRTIEYLARRTDRNSAKIGNLLGLIEETKEPGPRH